MSVLGFIVYPSTPNMTAMAFIKTHVALPQGGYWPRLTVQARLHAISSNALTFPEVETKLEIGDKQFGAFELEPDLFVWPQRNAEGKLTGGLDLLATSSQAVKGLDTLMSAVGCCIRFTPENIKRAESEYLKGRMPGLFCVTNHRPVFTAIQHALQNRAAMGDTSYVVLSQHDLILPVS